MPTSGAQAFDYTKVHLTFTNDNNTDGVGFTVYNIADANSNAYWNSVGGKLNNSVKATVEYSAAVKDFSTTETSGAMAKNYYIAKANFASINTGILRAEDLVEYNVAANLSTDGFDSAAFAVAEQVFAGYTDDGEISDLDDALKVYYYYLNFAEQLTDYEPIASNIRTALSVKDYGQVEIVNEIDAILSEYATFDDAKYLESKTRYDAVKNSYGGLSSFAKDLVKDKISKLDTWFNSAYSSYYVTTGSYFGSLGYNNSTEELSKSFVRAKRNSDGTTTITLPDKTDYTLGYGTELDTSANTYTDYKVSLSDFSMTFSLDSVPTNARFAINFATDRRALPCMQNTISGLTIMFRSDWGTANQLSVSLVKTIASLGEYPNSNEVANIGEYGNIGLIGSDLGRYTEDVIVKFEADGENYKLTVSLGTSSATATLTKTFMDSIFVDVNNENATVDYTSLSMSMTVGEGLTSYGGGQDIVLTVKNINDGYFRSVAQTKNDIAAFTETVAALKTQDVLTIQQITSFNNNAVNITQAITAMRTYENAECNTLFAAIGQDDYNAINAKAAAFVSSKLTAVNVTVDNYAEANETLTEIERYWAVLSAEQKALYADYETTLARCKQDVIGCGAAKSVIDSITTIVNKTLLPSNVEEIKAERDAVKSAYDLLDSKYAQMVTNYSAFTEYSDTLDAYDPAGSVENAITDLFVTYENLTSANLSAAKTAVLNVKAAYNELTETQKAEVENYSRIAEFEEKITAFEKYVIDYATAALVVEAISESETTYATVTAENRDAAVAAIASLTQQYNALTDIQKAMVENYAKIAELQDKVAAYDAEVVAIENANAVIAKINAIGTVALTDDCKAKIDEARDAYDKLNDAAKSKVSNLSILTDAESTYAQLKAVDESAKTDDNKSGCGSSFVAYSAIAAITVIFGVAVMLAKKRNEF